MKDQEKKTRKAKQKGSDVADGDPSYSEDVLGQVGKTVQAIEEAAFGYEHPEAWARHRMRREKKGKKEAWRLNMAFFPHSGRVQTIPFRSTAMLSQFLKRPLEFNENNAYPASQVAWERVGEMSKRYRYLRGYEKDVELLNLELQSGEYSLMCPDVLRMGTHEDRVTRAIFRATSRASMMAHVPELSLVVVGSPIGRVLLMTPTKLGEGAEPPPPPTTTRTGRREYPKHGLRMEWVLPFASDEEAHRPRGKMRPLHGMAIGPVQYDEERLCGREVNEAAMPRRYRLMLHYRDHSILTYELTRDTETGKICFF
ncbi:hypothetical protein ESCO_004861 [Escovopsis weberi]|uniref:Uncharacterized protein n=1 Tax=Escovopsis weberi TaxID=150374 RepID=A0A0M8MZ72_ESCWE|nr:hypothetical protein ESCO_004861 [Escovopsis weberi]